MTEKRKFTQSPLPFVGQKRMFLKQYEALLNQCIENEGEGWTILDAFGGSGLLSHTAKRLKPKARVIYNDFDNFKQRLDNIADINRLRRQLAEIVGNEKEKKISEEKRVEVIEAIQQFDGFISVPILTSWLCFSGVQFADLNGLFSRKPYYNCVPKSDYKTAEGYLDGVEIVKACFSELLPQYAGKEKTLIVLDPPYLCTDHSTYGMANYFNVVDFIKLTKQIRPPFILFSSSKSEFKAFIDAKIANQWTNWQSFEGYENISLTAKINQNSQYVDNLMYKL